MRLCGGVRPPVFSSGYSLLWRCGLRAFGVWRRLFFRAVFEVCDGLWALAGGLGAPAAAAVLADGFGVGSGLGFAVGDGGDDEDEAGGTEGEDDPEGPGDTAAVLGFGLGDGLDEDVGAVAVWACHGVASFSMRGAGGG